MLSSSCQGPARLGPGPGVRRLPEFRQRLSERVNGLITALDPNLHVGICVVAASDGAVVFERNSSQRFVPASTLKIFTGAAALQWLGPQHRFQTDVAVDEVDKTGRTARNLYLRGSGDPSVSWGTLGDLAGALRQQGVTAITGDLIVDNSAFDAVPWGRGWMWDDLQDGYSAPISAVNVASNNLVIQVLPGSRVGTPVRVITTPTTNFVTLTNLATTAAAATTSSLHIAVNNAPPDPLGLQVGQEITLSGALASDSPAKYRRFAVRDPTVWAGTLFKEQLRAQHIDVLGFIRHGVMPPGASVLAQHTSAQLSAILTDAMKVSDNHAMECLLKRMGQVTALAPGNWSNGTQAVRRFLQQFAGLDLTGLTLEDGSGGSRYSLLNPSQMTRLLLYARNSFEIGPELIGALPIGGADGTLAHRMVASVLNGRVRAKTGSMTGVSNLAGYLHTEDDEVLAFTFFMDGTTQQAASLRQLQDSILLQLHAGARL